MDIALKHSYRQDPTRISLQNIHDVASITKPFIQYKIKGGKFSS